MAKDARIFRAVAVLGSMLAALVSAGARGQDVSTASGVPGPAETRQASPARDGQASERGALPGHTSKRTVLHFEDDSIRGDLTRPDGELVQAPRRVAEGSLVRVRRSFIDRALAGAVRGE
jgi:hypothetical protein